MKYDMADLDVMLRTLEKVKEEPEFIEYIENPTEEMQLIAIKNDIHISMIENPTEKVQMEAIKKDIHTIEFIEEPTEEMMLFVLNEDISFFDTITNKTEKVIKELLKNKENLPTILAGHNENIISLAISMYGYEAIYHTRIDETNIDKFRGAEASLLNFIARDTNKNSNKIMQYIKKYPNYIDINMILAEEYLDNEDIANLIIQNSKYIFLAGRLSNESFNQLLIILHNSELNDDEIEAMISKSSYCKNRVKKLEELDEIPL
jgi:hypothetical protein